jgi:hypothetical protein
MHIVDGIIRLGKRFTKRGKSTKQIAKEQSICYSRQAIPQIADVVLHPVRRQLDRRRRSGPTLHQVTDHKRNLAIIYAKVCGSGRCMFLDQAVALITAPNSEEIIHSFVW